MRHHTLSRLAAAVLLSLAAPGCTSLSFLYDRTHHSYRMETNDANPERNTVKTVRDSTAMIGFLEFDDQGSPWRRGEDGGTGWRPGRKHSTQLPNVVEAIGKLSARGPVRMLIFIHGWNNNAAPGNHNLRDFEHTLRTVAAGQPSMPVFGVFVAWRGMVSERRPLFVDVSSREATAGRVGRAPLMASLRAVTSAARRHPRSRVMAIGHSFGAKILAQVVTDHVASRIGHEAGADGAVRAEKLEPLADTIILANTAEGGILPLQMMNLMRDYEVKYTNPDTGREIPMVISLSSANDRATKLLPVWNGLTRDILGLPHKGGATANKVQKNALYNSMGYYGPLKSHLMMNEAGAQAAGQKAKWNTAKDAPDAWGALLRENRYAASWPAGERGSFQVRLSPTGDLGTMETFTVRRLRRDEEAFTKWSRGAELNETPFWALQVPDYVCSGHSDIWNPNFLGLVTAIDALSVTPPPRRTSPRPAAAPEKSTLMEVKAL